MTNELEVANMPEESIAIDFGVRLKASRQQRQLEIKDVAAQLRLNEKVITKLEEGIYPDNIPTTFLRGYLRAYAKLLQIPADEVKAALEPIKEAPQLLALPQSKAATSFTSENYYMQFFTYLIVFTMLGLVGIWWHSHTSTTENTSLISMQNENSIPLAQSAPSALRSTLSTTQQAPEMATPPIASNTTPAATTLSPVINAATPSVALATPKNVKRAEVSLYGDAEADEANTNE